MSYAAHHKDFGAFASSMATPKGDAVPKKAGILRRIFDAMTESRQKEDERQIARLLAWSGRAFNDDLEREITSRLMTSNWSVNADLSDRRLP